MSLDTDLFGTHDVQRIPLKTATALHFLLHEIIGARVLLANKVQGCPDVNKTMRKGEIVNNSFFTGNYFLETFKNLITKKDSLFQTELIIILVRE